MGSSLITVAPEDAGTRLDRYLSRHLNDITRSRVKKLIEEGHILVDGASVKAGTLLKAGALLTVTIPPAEPSPLAPEAIPIRILHEDQDLIVIDKPPHMVVHPSYGHATGTLVQALLHHCSGLSGIGGVTRPGIVHRLDKGTSGVLIAAKNDAAHQHLAAQFKDHSIGRVYLAAVRGTLRSQDGRIEKPLARHTRDRKRIGVRPEGRRAVTDYRVLGRRGGMTLLELRPGTGRTHQLRVHLASEGHPILGDATYGGGTRPLEPGDRKAAGYLRSLKRPALHALKLEFDHPATGRRMSFEAPPPEDLQGLFEWIMGRDT